MTTFESILLILLSIVAIALTVLVLMQQGKGADVGAAFGSGSSNTVFGATGSAPFLTKLTTWLAILFFSITFGIAYLAKEKVASVNRDGIPETVLDREDIKTIDAKDFLDTSRQEFTKDKERDDSIPDL